MTVLASFIVFAKNRLNIFNRKQSVEWKQKKQQQNNNVRHDKHIWRKDVSLTTCLALFNPFPLKEQ
jgi:hypothetical protein